MTHPQIPILDGRRAVPGDLVECIDPIHVDWDTGFPAEGPRLGERFIVVAVSDIAGEKALMFDEWYIPNEGYIEWEAAGYKIIPPDTKAETRMEISSTHSPHDA
jgi:hypothetical protein